MKWRTFNLGMIVAALGFAGCASQSTSPPPALSADEAPDEQWISQPLRTGGNGQTCLAGQVKFLIKVKGDTLYAYTPRVADTSSYHPGPTAAVPLKADGSANEVVRFGNGDSGRVIVAPGKGPRPLDVNTMRDNCSYRFAPA